MIVGYAKVGDTVISWGVRKQKTVALSSTEAEYMAASDATKDVITKPLARTKHRQYAAALGICEILLTHTVGNSVHQQNKQFWV